MSGAGCRMCPGLDGSSSKAGTRVCARAACDRVPIAGALPCLTTSACAAASRASTAAALPAFFDRLLCWGEVDAEAGEDAWPCEVGVLAGLV